jgi:hypothetical protein
MKKMKPMKLLPLLFLLPLCLGMSMQEDDLVFDDVGEETPTVGTESESPQHQQSRDNTLSKGKTAPPMPFPKHAKKWQGVQKLLPIHDSIATVGHVFKLHIPKDLFTGSLDYYEVRFMSLILFPFYFDSIVSSCRWLLFTEYLLCQTLFSFALLIRPSLIFIKHD